VHSRCVVADFFARDLTSRKLDPTRVEGGLIEVDDVYREHYLLKRMVKVAQRCLVRLDIERADEYAASAGGSLKP
jgi:hypothetical protein